MTSSIEGCAIQLLERCSRHLERPPAGYSYYEAWLQSEEEVVPGVSHAVAVVARRTVDNPAQLLVRSAIQALACVGSIDDVVVLERLKDSRDRIIAAEASEAINYIQNRLKSVEDLLGEVDSAASFIAFARALAKEREQAAEIEHHHPEKYRVDGALDWKNADIASFIYSGLTAVERLPRDAPATWSIMARFLYSGKIYE